MPYLGRPLLGPPDTGVPVEDRIRRAPTLIIVNEQVGSTDYDVW